MIPVFAFIHETLPTSCSVSLLISQSNNKIYPFSKPTTQPHTPHTYNKHLHHQKMTKKGKGKKNKDTRSTPEKEPETAEQRAERRRRELQGTAVTSTSNGHYGHHCLKKDAATTHAMTRKCFENGHMGVCPECKRPASRRYGCTRCGVSGKALLSLKESEEMVRRFREESTSEEDATRQEHTLQENED